MIEVSAGGADQSDLEGRTTLARNIYKFGLEGDGQTHEYDNAWALERTTGPDRLVIAPADNQVQLLMELMRSMSQPYWILYVLLVSRTGATPGRYQVPEPRNRQATESFLMRFSEFFEKDARHHLWIGSEGSEDLLVYDNHNVIYAYGDLPKFEEVLNRARITHTESVRFPSPHSHHYNVEFDTDEEAMLQHWEWKLFPLQDSDDR